MTAAEGSFVGIAKQTAKGTPNVTDADFTYLLFNEGALSPQNIFRETDPEVGGGALSRGVKKLGVTSGGALRFSPRPDSLGWFLLGALGQVASVDNTDGSYTHTFTLPTDQFDAPYFTGRAAPGNLWGEQYQDMRVSALSLDWAGADFVRGSVGLMGGLPTPVSTAAWSPETYLDAGPQLISPVSTIELPTGTAVKLLRASFSAGMQIPMNEQWIVGSYSPDAFDINRRMFALSMTIKVDDAGVLYKKMAYDPASGSAWAADVFREADLNIELTSDIEAATGTPYSLTIAANGQNAASGAANVYWSVQPLPIRAGGQIVMNVTGIFAAYSSAPITLTLINQVDDSTY